MMKSTFIALLLALIALPLSCQGNNMKLDSSRGTFEKMLVFINDNVPEHEGRLLESLKDSLKAASKALWTATDNLDPIAAPNAQSVQFGNIFIRVPSTWTVHGQQLTWQQCTKADFFLTTNADNGNRWQPVTKQLGKCGQPAESMRLPESFFLNLGQNASLREKGKILMAEFAKLRYGVFSEKPYKQMLTVFNGFTFINSTCGPHIRWELSQPMAVCSEPNSGCKYSIESAQNHNYSVMFDSGTPSSEYFCNDHNRRHNQMAKTLHNLKCKRRSVANVILSHTDFISTRPRRPYVDPTFSVVRGDNRRIVLVIDTSPSMSGIIETVRQVASTFVSDFVEKSALVGLVEFNKVGRIVVPLTAVDSASNRQLLIDRIHSLSPQGMTNIADGLLQAVKVLGGDIEDAHSVLGTIILLSDGSNNHGSHYDRYIEAVINKGIVANTISYGTAADRKLTRLAEGSNGKFLFAASNDYSQLLSVFSYQDSCEAMLNMTTKIMEDEVELQWDVPSTYLTYVDRFAGTNVRIDVTVSMDVIVKKHDPIVVILLDELGNVHQPITSTTHQSRRTHAFRIPKVPVKVDVQITGMQKVSRISSTVHFVVFSGNLVGSRNILPTGKLLMSEIPLLTSLTEVPVYVDLTSCGLETGENVTVTLTMSDPTILKSSFRMTDDGLGSDSISGDQIYSTSLYAKDFKVVGFFTFSASVLIRNSDGDIVKRNVDVGCLRILAVQPQPLEDKIAPSLIDYVGVKVGDSTRRTVVLKFRASGDDGTQGEISKYKVKVNWPEDRTKEVIIVHVFKVIVSPGNMIQMKVDLSKFNVTNPFWIRVLGEDDMGNMGEWSQPTTSNWLYEDIKKKSIVEEQSLHIMVYLIDFTVVSVLWLNVFFVNLTKWSIVQHLCACTFHLVLHYCFYNCRLMHPAYVYVCSVDYWEILPFVVDMGPFSYLTVSVLVALVVILSTRLLRHRLHSRLHMLSGDQTRSPGYQSESCQNSLPDSMQ